MSDTPTPEELHKKYPDLPEDDIQALANEDKLSAIEEDARFPNIYPDPNRNARIAAGNAEVEKWEKEGERRLGIVAAMIALILFGLLGLIVWLLRKS